MRRHIRLRSYDPERLTYRVAAEFEIDYRDGCTAVIWQGRVYSCDHRHPAIIAVIDFYDAQAITVGEAQRLDTDEDSALL